MNGYMYILKCSDGSYYTGSTKDLELRLQQHQNGEGANHTKKRLPVELVYYEEFNRIDEAFYREKQVQGWSRKKKEALINAKHKSLHKLAECKNATHHTNVAFDSAAFDSNTAAFNTNAAAFDSAQAAENRSRKPAIERSCKPAIERSRKPAIERSRNEPKQKKL